MKKTLPLLFILFLGLVAYQYRSFIPSEPNTQITQPLQSDAEPSTIPAAALHAPRLSTDLLELETVKSEQTVEIVTQPHPEWRLNSPLAEHISQLQDAALTGDAKAAFVLGMNLLRCYNVPADEQAFAQHLQLAFDRKDNDISLSKLRESYQFCLGITMQQRSEFYPMLAGAADMGLVPAQEILTAIAPEVFMKMMAATNLSRDDYIRQRDAFIARQKDWREAAAGQGSIRALMQIGQRHYQQLDGPNGRMKAFAFQQVLLEFLDDNELYSRYSKYQQTLQQQLSAQELEQAQAISAEWIAKIRNSGTLYPL